MPKLTTNVYTSDVSIRVSRFTSSDSKERVNVSFDGEDNYFSLETAIEIHAELEKLVVDSEYRYEAMQAENDRLNQRILDLEEALDNIDYMEAV